MKFCKFIIVFVNILFFISLCCCVPDEVILHGDIRGYVTDAETSQPVQDAYIELNQSNNTIPIDTTLSDGSYFFKNQSPGDYEIEASKLTYEKVKKNATVSSTITTEVDFELNRAAFAEYSDTYLDFGLDTTIKSLTISNAGPGTLNYSLFTSKDWISVDPPAGNATTETDTIKVTIDRTGLAENTHKEILSIVYYSGNEQITDTVDVFSNGLIDRDGNYYNVVTIGTQTWMAENLNTGTKIDLLSYALTDTMNNSEIEKYCYDNDEINCDIYGGLYTWWEMMDYPLPGFDPESIIQGICPDGWHIPKFTEWANMINILGMNSGGKVKDTGTVEDGDGYWYAPNSGATNESGFTALPGGGIVWPEDIEEEADYLVFREKGERFYTWIPTGLSDFEFSSRNIILFYDHYGWSGGFYYPGIAHSVRCIKDPE